MTEALQGKVYIVTGASRGFGYGICEALLEQGAKVAMLARNSAGLDAARDGLAKAYDGACIYTAVCDVSDGASVNAAFAGVKEHFGVLNGIVNNAGLARPGSVENLVDEEVLLQVNTNFVGTVLCCKAAIPLLKGEDNPRIINISSASAWHYDEMLHLSIYASTKAAVERFTRDLRLEAQHHDIGVTCIRPGAAWTTFSEGWNEEALMAGYKAWAHHFGDVADAGMEIAHVAESVCFALAYPPGVAVDLLEVRPNRIEKKF